MGTDAILLRTQPDGRLVRLVREGYETAFEEIVRRYRRPLDRFAASIVGGRSEDVTQDSFRKALVALRREDGEIELRPWLYRIVRNTALNDLRDRPPAAAELAEDLIGGGRSAAAVAEERAEIGSLTAKLRALPENQRAALVMRELEGMSHEEIAARLGISGGAARQAIARGRAAVRGGLGGLVPLPLLRALAGGGGDAATEAAVGAGATATGVGALKVGLATVVVAGGIGAGIAIDHHDGGRHASDPPKAVAHAPAPRDPRVARVESTPVPVAPPPAAVEIGGDHGREGHEGHARHESHRHHGSGPGPDHGSEVEPAVAAEPVVVADPAPEPGESGRGGDDRSGHGSGSDGGGSGSGSRSGLSDPSSGGHGSDDAQEVVAEVPPVEVITSSSGPGPSSSSSSGSGGSGSSGGPSPTLDESGSSGGSGTSGGHGSDDDSEISP